MGRLRTLFKRKTKKIPPDSCEKEGILKFLSDKYGNYISSEILPELAEVIAEQYQKRIKIVILKEMAYWVTFSCNLSPEEMKLREAEVRLLLPKTSASEDYMYNVELKPCRWKEVDFPHPSRSKDGWWSYLARA